MLRVQNISWQINNKNILKNISFAISPGECLGLVGPNGSGKSSLLKILALLEPPSAGEIWFQGQQVPQKIPLDTRRKIAIVFQEALLLDTSVWDNVATGLKIRGLAKAEIKKRTSHWLEQFGIAHLAKQSARSLSGGEAQRASLARAFALEPDILFLDEPFSALDAPTKEALRTDLQKVFATTKVTTVLVSHDFNDILRLTQRTLLLLEGELVADAPPAALLSMEYSEKASHFLAHWSTQAKLASY